MTLCRCGLESFGLSGCYWCLKQRLDWSQHPPAPDGLNETERAFVGIFPPRPRDGWRPADLELYGPEDTRDFLNDAAKRLLPVLCDPPSPGRETEIDV